ncbi:MAG: hypothetical protein FJ152_03125 [Firmicutes bacterium]|nr:hypothetical protein [Bacillota bacterium]
MIIALGIIMLLLIPFLVHIIRTDPMRVVRSVWHEAVTPKFAEMIGILVVLIAFIGGLWAIFKGLRLL